MINERPPIPEGLKRKVRKRCGFGCVICGLPLYHYDHIIDYSAARDHHPDNMTLLCAKHHDEKTRGLLDRATVETANDNPYNPSRGTSTPHVMRYSGDFCIVAVGSVLLHRTYQGAGTMCAAVVIDRLPMVAFTLEEGGNLLLTVNLFDQHGRHILAIDRSQLVYSLHPWDITFVGTRLTIFGRYREILLRIRFKVPNLVIIERGQFMHNGIDVIARQEYLAVVNKNVILSYVEEPEAQMGLVLGSSLGMGIHVPVGIEQRYAAGGYSATDRRIVETTFRGSSKGS